jgi:membrane protein required for colicin V production
MNLADIIVFVILILSAAIAFARGFVREVLSIGAWVGAAVATIYGFSYAQPIARRYIEMTLIADIVAGVVIFVVVLTLLTVLSHMLAKTVRGSALGAVDRSLGLLFGLARGAVLICIGYMVLVRLVPEPADRPTWFTEARTLPIVQQSAEYLRSLLPESALQQGTEAADQARDAVNQAIGTGETLQDLSGAGAPAPAGTQDSDAPPDSAGGEKPSGYNDAERNDLERLIQGTQ